MLRRIAILSVLLAIGACAGGAWAARSALTAPFIAPGATSVAVSEARPGERQISYFMPNPDSGWQTVVARRLIVSGWSLAADRYQWGDTEKITTLAVYARTSVIGFLVLRERAELLGDRSNAIIRVSYVVASQR
jgi:hypothetical protein